MESPHSSDANKQIVLISTKMEQEQDQEQYSSESEVQAAAADEEPLALPPPPGFENYQLAMVEHDREYGCRYCDKKFSNKQALGGHQNAHKVERSMEKNDHETSIDFYGGGPNPNPARMDVPAPFLNSYPPRPSDFLNRSLFSWGCGGGGGGGGGVITYSPHNCNAYHGWSAPPCPRVPHFSTRPGPYMMNIRLPNFGPGSSRAFRPVFHHQGPQGFGRYVVRTGASNWPAGPVNLKNVPGRSYDESGLDLSLKLGYNYDY